MNERKNCLLYIYCVYRYLCIYGPCSRRILSFSRLVISIYVVVLFLFLVILRLSRFYLFCFGP